MEAFMGVMIIHAGVCTGLLITEEVALRDAKMGSLLRKAGVPAWSALATLLVEIRNDGTASNSPWASYVAVLPSTCGCVLEWPRKEVCNKCTNSPDVMSLIDSIHSQLSQAVSLSEGHWSEARQSKQRPTLPVRRQYF